MIRFSALLVALAIGLLVAGVAASNLPLVYVSIAVCAVAALLLAAGVLRHWPEIFGSGAKRTEPSPFAASRPVPSTATASPATAGPATAGRAASRRLAGSTRAGPGMAGFRADAGAAPAARGPEPTVAADRYWAAQRPAESGPEPARAEPIHAAPTDDLWDRVNEELESAGKRDSGRLSWPAQDFSIPSGMSLPAEPPEPETLAGPGARGSDDLWQPAAGWQPPRTPQSSWPFAPPAESASARPAGRDTEPDDDAGAAAAASETVAARPARPDETTRSAPVADAPSQAEADRDRGPVGRAEAAERDDAAERGQAAQRDDAAGRGGPADGDAAPRWTIRPQPGPGSEATVVSTPPVTTPTARAAEPSRAAEPAEPAQEDETVSAAGEARADEPAEAAEPAEATEAAEATQVAEPVKAAGPAQGAESAAPAEPVKPAESAKAAEPAGPAKAAAPTAAEPAEAAESGSAGEPDDAGQPAADAKTETAKTETDGAAEKPAKPAKPAGPVQVTVVPGVARYHRAECILIRFLGADDLETMPKQQAVSDGLIACRACQPDELPDS